MAIYNREDFMTALPQIEAEIESFRKQMKKELKELDDKIEQFSSGVADVLVNGTSVVTNSIASITVPTKVSQLTNDSGFITTETDPTVPSWAKQSTKPSYTASEVGALPASTTIPSKTSDLTNDSGFITTETDPTVPSWAKASSKPTYTASEVGALPSSTAIPSKTSDLTNDSGFITGYTETDPTVPSWAKASSKPSYTASEVGALASADLYTRSSAGGLDWGTGATGNMVIAKSALAFWNGSYDGATSNLQRLNATVYVGGTQMKDFIKEQGTSSSWYYRKWNSGKIEAWKAHSPGSQTPAQWVTGWYYKDLDITIPSGIFSSAPTTANVTNKGTDYQFSVFAAVPTSATNIRVRLVKPNSGAATPILSIYATNM